MASPTAYDSTFGAIINNILGKWQFSRRGDFGPKLAAFPVVRRIVVGDSPP
jgi:hypothetical protein